MRFTAHATYRCSAAFYWQAFFDESSRRRREVEGCGSADYRVLARRSEQGVVTQRAELVPQVPAPGSVVKLFGDRIRLLEDLEWREGADSARVTWRPDLLGDRVAMAGQLRADPDGEHTRITLDLEVTASIFGVGGIVEKMAAAEVPEHLRRDAAWFNQHLAPAPG